MFRGCGFCRVKAEEQSQSSSSGTRKKVTFDPIVRTYEYVLPEHVSDTLPEKDEVGTKEEESFGKSGHSQPSSAASSITLSSGSYPPNHRYQNCRECDDEEDEIDYEDTDLDDEDDDGVLDYDDMYEEDGIVESKIDVAKEEIEEAVKPIKVNGSARDGSAYIHSVRNPVENLDQWKALKMKGKLQLKQQYCRECDDEEDEIDYEDSDLDDEEDDGVLDYDDDMYEEDGIVESKIAVAKEEIEEAVKPIRVNGSARDGSAYIHSVRNPVENLDQWKALKMKGKLQLKQQYCRECDNEEDEIDYEDSDLDDEEDDGVLDYDDMYEEDGIVESKIAVAKEEMEPTRVNGSARDRSAYIHSVRNPVDNLTQWKALKMKGKLQDDGSIK